MRKRKQIAQRYGSFSSGRIGDWLYNRLSKVLPRGDYSDFQSLNRHDWDTTRLGPISFRILFNKDLEVGR